MLVLMPIAGRFYDRIGPRWPAVLGLALNGYGTYLLCGINPDVTRQDIIAWTMIRAVGIGMSMMPIMTAGISALPPRMLGSGSAFANLAQRVSAALGLAALTAMSTAMQTQAMTNRAMLIDPTDPRIQAMRRDGGVMGLYPLMQRTQLSALAESYSNVFLLSAVLTFAAMLLALCLRTGRAATGSGAGPVEL